MADTRQLLLEHFDEEVHAHIKINYDVALRTLDAVGRKFWRLSRHILGDMATFDETNLVFHLDTSPLPGVRPGIFTLNRKRDARQDSHVTSQVFAGEGCNLYRLNHPLGEYCVEQGKALKAGSAHVEFDLTGYDARLSAVEPLLGKSGWLLLNRLVIDSLEREEYLLFTGFTDQGKVVASDVLEQFFRLDGKELQNTSPSAKHRQRLQDDAALLAQATIRRSLEENNKYFQERREQLHRWADDVVKAAEHDLEQAKANVRAANRAAALATTVADQKQAQENVREMERRKRRARQRIFEVEDEIEVKRDALIKALEKKMVQNTENQSLFMLRWTIV